MFKKRLIKCACNHTITEDDIIQIGLIIKSKGPFYVFLKFHCPECDQYGNTIIEHRVVKRKAFKKFFSEQSTKERKKFNRLKPISSNELIEFHKKVKELM